MSCTSKFIEESQAMSEASGVPSAVAVLHYSYVDASNWKQHSEGVAFANPDGILLKAATVVFNAHADSGEIFVAEQVGVPTEYFSGEPGSDDHGIHTFDDWEAGEDGQEASDERTLKEFLEKVGSTHLWMPDPDRLGYDDEESWNEDEDEW